MRRFAVVGVALSIGALGLAAPRPLQAVPALLHCRLRFAHTVRTGPWTVFAGR